MLGTLLIVLAFISMSVITFCVYMRNRQLQKDNRRLKIQYDAVTTISDRSKAAWSRDYANLEKTAEVLTAERDQAWYNLELVLAAETENAELIEARRDRDLAMKNLEMVLSSEETFARGASVEIGRAGVYYHFTVETPQETDEVASESSPT